jgi:hypothetical protein
MSKRAIDQRRPGKRGSEEAEKVRNTHGRRGDDGLILGPSPRPGYDDPRRQTGVGHSPCWACTGTRKPVCQMGSQWGGTVSDAKQDDGRLFV